MPEHLALPTTECTHDSGCGRTLDRLPGNGGTSDCLFSDVCKSGGERAHVLNFVEGQLVERQPEEDSGKSVVAGSLVVSERFE